VCKQKRTNYVLSVEWINVNHECEEVKKDKTLVPVETQRVDYCVKVRSFVHLYKKGQ
jgi:hypothetical protein